MPTNKKKPTMPLPWNREPELPEKPKRPKVRFNPKPVWKMTDQEAYAFACRQAQEAADHIRTTTGRMTNADMEQYAAAVYQGIIYFNRRDPRHKEYMRYLEELREKEEERERDAQDGQLQAKIKAALK